MTYLNKKTITLQLRDLFTCVVVILNQNYNINILNIMYLVIFFLPVHADIYHICEYIA